MYSANSARSSTTFGLRGNVTSWGKRSGEKDGVKGWSYRNTKSYRPGYVLSPPANRRREGLLKLPAYSASFQASCYSPPTKSKQKPIIVSDTEKGMKQKQKKNEHLRDLFLSLSSHHPSSHLLSY